MCCSLLMLLLAVVACEQTRHSTHALSLSLESVRSRLKIHSFPSLSLLHAPEGPLGSTGFNFVLEKVVKKLQFSSRSELELALGNPFSSPWKVLY